MFVGPAHRDPSTRKRDGLSLHLARWAGLALPGQNSDFSEIDYDPVRPIPSLALLRCVFIGDGTMHSNMKRVKIWDRACDRPLTFTVRPGFHDILGKSLFLRTCRCENSSKIVWHHPRMERRCLDLDIGPSGFNVKKSLRFCILSTPNTSSVLLKSFNPSFFFRSFRELRPYTRPMITKTKDLYIAGVSVRVSAVMHFFPARP